VQVSRPEDYLPNAAFSGSPFQVADAPPNLPGGGSATTVYDEHDRPTEVQVRDAQGELVSRAVCIYDAQGRVVEEKQILDNPERIILAEILSSDMPAKVRAKILDESSGIREQLREQFTELMGGQAGPFSMAYSYDAQGRVKQTRSRIYNREDTIETTYNEHGDIVEECTTSAKSIPAGVTFSPDEKGSLVPDEPPQPDLRTSIPIHYTYQYDSFGNWTEKVEERDQQPFMTRRRQLTYY
jgi:hypothetical protein